VSQVAPVDYVRTFNRYEYKYVIPETQARALIRDLAPFTLPDPYSPTERGYPVHSIYWDSRELVFFWEKIDGQTVQKRRVMWSQERIAQVFRDGAIDAEREYEVTDPVGQEALLLCHFHGLEPKMAIAYRRRAFFGAHEHDLRITFDTRLQYDSRALDIRARWDVGKYLMPADQCVLEIKFNHFVPRWLITLVGKHALCSTRFSKYCRAIDLEFFGGRFT
jgi:hypothetical protein